MTQTISWRQKLEQRRTAPTGATLKIRERTQEAIDSKGQLPENEATLKANEP
jgi:hypothetical protein